MGRHLGEARHDRRMEVRQNVPAEDKTSVMVEGRERKATDDHDAHPKPRRLLILLAVIIMAPFSAVVLNLFLAQGIFAIPAVNKHEPRQSRTCSVNAFNAVLPPEARAVKAENVPAGTTNYGENPANVFGNALEVPALCAVTVDVSIPAQNSRYHFGLFLPDTWNGNFLAVGNGGQAGGINWMEMGPGPFYGLATMSTDTGHLGGSDDFKFARNPGSLEDWGYRAVNGSIHYAKTLVQSYYGAAPGKSYWSGCSTGGRQGLKQVQIAPESLDGLLIGAAAWDTKHLFPWIAKLATYNLPIGAANYLSSARIARLATEVRSQCDAKDGVPDGVPSDPLACDFDFAPITCPTGGADCLSPEQIQTVRNVWADYSLDGGRFVHPGFNPTSEVLWPTFLSDQSMQDGSPIDRNPFDLKYFRHFLYPAQENDTRWNNYDYFTQNEAAIIQDSETTNPGQATADAFDITAFKDRGGKILMYHGTADGIVPTHSSVQYYTSTAEAMGNLSQEEMDRFFRLFLVPGLGHCNPFTFPNYNERDVPWHIGGANQQALPAPHWSVAGHLNQSTHDVFAALVSWVGGGGSGPERIIATSYDPFNSYVEYRQRPICKYPLRQVFNGNVSNPGEVNSSANWTCIA